MPDSERLHDAREAVLNWGPGVNRSADMHRFTEIVAVLERAAKAESWAVDEQGYEIIVMDEIEIDHLPEYSTSKPTGVFFGKRWKCARHWANPDDHTWLLLGYDFDPRHTDSAVTHPRRIMTPEQYAGWAAAAPDREKPR